MRAAFWAVVLTLAAALVACPKLKRGGDILEGASPLYVGGVVVMLPGMLMTGAVAWIASQIGNPDAINHKAVSMLWLSAPTFSWLFYFALLSLIAWSRRQRDKVKGT